MTEGSELISTPIPEKPKQGLIGNLREKLGSRSRGFNWERWIDPEKPDHETRDHTIFVQHQAFECSEIFKAKGYSSFSELTGAVHQYSDNLLINEHFLGKYQKKEGTWVDKSGKVVGISDMELKGLERAIVAVEPEVREKVQDRVVARYLFLRDALMTAVVADKVYGGEDQAPMLAYRVQNPYLGEVSLMMKNPYIINLFISAAIARETAGDAMKLYDPNYAENALNSPEYLFGLGMAVRRELAERIPPLDKIKVPFRNGPVNSILGIEEQS